MTYAQWTVCTKVTGRLKKDFQAETQVSVEIPGKWICFVFKGIYIDPRRIYTAPILGWRVTPSADAKHRSSLRTLDTASGTRHPPTTGTPERPAAATPAAPRAYAEYRPAPMAPVMIRPLPALPFPTSPRHHHTA